MATGNAWGQVAPQLDSNTHPWAVIQYDNQIYAGIHDSGRLNRWTGVNAWEVAAAPLYASSIRSLAIHGGLLYGGTQDLFGPVFHRGNLYLYTGSAWEQKAPQFDAPNNTIVGSLCSYGGTLYGGTGLMVTLAWNGVNEWGSGINTVAGVQGPNDLIIYNGKMYASSNKGLYQFDDVADWVSVSGIVIIASMVVFNGALYAASGGELYVWNDVDTLTRVATVLGGEGVYSLGTFDGKLYGGTSTTGLLYEWNAVNAWVKVANQLNGQGRIQGLVAYKAKLYGITQPGGRLFQWNGTITSSGQVIVVK